MLRRVANYYYSICRLPCCRYSVSNAHDLSLAKDFHRACGRPSHHFAIPRGDGKMMQRYHCPSLTRFSVPSIHVTTTTTTYESRATVVRAFVDCCFEIIVNPENHNTRVCIAFTFLATIYLCLGQEQEMRRMCNK
jgi:hypothetical protein